MTNDNIFQSQRLMWLIGAFFYAYQFILRVMPNVMLNEIMNQFQFDTQTFGQFSGVYYIGYCLAHIPIGMMLDRFGPKQVLPVFIILTVLGLLPLLCSDFWLYPIIGRACIGIGSSAAILGAFKIIRLTFSENKFTSMLSWTVTIGLIGGIYGGSPVSKMLTIYGFHETIRLFVIIGFALSLITYMALPDVRPTTSTSLTSDIGAVFFNKKVMLVCLFAGLMVGPMEGFADVWGTAFLKQVYGFDTAIASSLPSFIFIGMCFGAPVLSLIAEKTNSYLTTIILSGFFMTISFVLLLCYHLSYFAISSLFTLIGVCCAYQIIAIYKASTYVADHVVGLTNAVANMIIMVFGYIFHSVIGLVIGQWGGIQSSLAFTYGISVIPIALAIGTTGFLVLSLKKSYHNTTSLA